jgi:hypothetical protein
VHHATWYVVNALFGQAQLTIQKAFETQSCSLVAKILQHLMDMFDYASEKGTATQQKGTSLLVKFGKSCNLFLTFAESQTQCSFSN